ncbi:MAG: TetR/AcrR family transcriptional regulator [Marmoricola sp.]
MPRDATPTRERLIRAGEHRFARDGVAAARLRDIVRDAGQANDSAVGYHFGSRDGLVAAIAAKHVTAMEARREQPATDLDVLVRQLIEPTAELLAMLDGRDFLRIIEQLAGWAGLEQGQPTEVLSGSLLAAQLAALEDLLAAHQQRVIARHRVAEFVLFLTASLAQRARLVESGKRPTLTQRRYLDDLVAMTTAALLAGGA